MPTKSCPHCQQSSATRVRFTRWGGVVGPFLLNLVKCTACGSHFNGRSGRCVKSAIKMYTLATLLLLITLMALLMYQVAGTKKGSNSAPAKPGLVTLPTPTTPTA